MFHKVFCVRILIVLCLFNSISQTSEQNISHRSSNLEFERCEDVSGFLSTLYSLPPQEAFQQLISPLGCNSCPIEAKSIRHKLIVLVANGALDVGNILANLKNANLLNRNDVLISTLMIINETPGAENSLKADISDALFYFLRKRYLGRSHFGSARNGFCEYRRFSTAPNNWYRKGFPQPKTNLVPFSSWPNGNGGFYPKLRPSTKYATPNSVAIPSQRARCEMKMIDALFKRVIDLEIQRKFSTQGLNTGGIQQRPVPRVIPGIGVPRMIPGNGVPIAPKSLRYNGSPSTYNPKSSPVCSVKKYTSLLPNYIKSATSPIPFGQSPQGLVGYRPNLVVTPRPQPGGLHNLPTRVIQPAFGVPRGYVPNLKPLPSQPQPEGPYNFPKSPIGFSKTPAFGKPFQGLPLEGQRPLQPATIIGNYNKPLSMLPYQGQNVPNFKQPQLHTVRQPEGPGINNLLPGPKAAVPIQPGVVTNPQETEKARINRIQNLINLVPAPTYPKEKQMYDELKELLRSPQVQELAKNINITDKQTDQEVFDIIITTILKTVHTETITEVFEFYSHYKEAEQSHFNYAVLMDALPHPQNPKEQGLYDILKTFLMGKSVYQIPQSDSFKTAPSLSAKLIILFETLAQPGGSLYPEVQHAVTYYLPIVRGKTADIQFVDMISSLPTPTSEEEVNSYNILKDILSSNNIYVLLQNVDLKNLSPDQQLTTVLNYLITQPQNPPLSSAANVYRDLLVTKKYGFSYFALLQLLPAQENATFIEILRNYFTTPEFETIVSKLQIANLSDRDKLLHILEAIKVNSTNPTVVQTVTTLYQNFQAYIFHQNINSVISLIPLPKTEAEKNVYTIVQSFLLSEKSYELLHHIDFTIFPNNKLLLEFVMKAVVDSAVEANIKDAFEYYIDLTERLESLEFVTRKEIRKNFKLTEILTDTLDLKSLTFEQKHAFKTFFKYISQLKGETMTNFDSWDQAKTRGEFMKILFAYLIKTPTTPPEIKESIQVLDSLVKMDGKAALPP